MQERRGVLFEAKHFCIKDGAVIAERCDILGADAENCMEQGAADVRIGDLPCLKQRDDLSVRFADTGAAMAAHAVGQGGRYIKKAIKRISLQIAFPNRLHLLMIVSFMKKLLKFLDQQLIEN